MTTQQEHLIQDQGEIASVLLSLQRAHSPVMIHFRGMQENYLSMLLDVDREQRCFTLDEMNNALAHNRALAGDTFSVRGSAKGVSVFFNDCRVTGTRTEAGSVAYLVDFPKVISYSQKRDAFRARVMRSMGLYGELVSYRRDLPLKAALLDMSNTGCRLGFRQTVEPPIEPFEIFEALTLNLPEPFESIQVAVEARHAIYHEEQKQTTCGFHFLQVDPRTQDTIDRFVMFLQREALRIDVR